MDLTLDELKLLADYRRLTAEGQKELLDYAAFQVGKHLCTADTPPGAANQCGLDREGPRPEAAEEPIFTE
jgi:hypothetical protein